MSEIRSLLHIPAKGTDAPLVQTGICCWGGNFFCIETGGDLVTGHPLHPHAENAPHHRSRIFIDNNSVFLCRVHLVAIQWFSADEQPLALLVALDALDFFRNILGVHVVHNCAEGCDIIGCAVNAGIDPIQE